MADPSTQTTTQQNADTMLTTTTANVDTQGGINAQDSSEAQQKAAEKLSAAYQAEQSKTAQDQAAAVYKDPYAGLIPSDKYPGKWFDPRTGITFTPSETMHPELMSGPQLVAQKEYQSQIAFSQAKTLEDYLALEPVGRQLQLERLSAIQSGNLPTKLSSEQVAAAVASAKFAEGTLFTGAGFTEGERRNENKTVGSEDWWKASIEARETQALKNSLPGTTFTQSQYTALTTPRAGEIASVYTQGLASVGASTSSYTPTISVGRAVYTPPPQTTVQEMLNVPATFDAVSAMLLKQQAKNPMLLTTSTALYDPRIVQEYGSMDTRQGKLNLAEIGLFGFSATAAAVALKGWADEAGKTITEYRDTGYKYADIVGPSLSLPLKGGIGFASGLAAATAPFVASLPYGVVYTVTNPTLAPAKGGEILVGTATDLATRFPTNPAGVGGELVGMYTGGKAIGSAAEGVNALSPVKVGIAPIATSTAEAGAESGITYVGYLATQKPAILSSIAGEVRPLPQVRAYVAGGEYSSAGVGTPTEFLKGLPEVNAPPLMRVRPGEGGIKPISPQQQVVLDPFFREVAKGTVEEPYVNAALTAKQVLPQTEAAFAGDYRMVGRFGEGASRIEGVSPEVSSQILEAYAEAGGKYVGSSSLGDIYGTQNIRGLSGSDIDISIMGRKAVQAGLAKENLLTPTTAKVAEIVKSNPEPVVQSGAEFTVVGKPEHFTAIKGGETTLDVRTFDVTTPEGNILKYGTPEYQIETKFSRLGGYGGVSKATGLPQDTIGLRYTQEGGLEVPLDLKKGAKDFADIYSGSAYLSRETAIKGMPGVSRAYEQVATDIKAYAEASGKGELFAEIKGNPLAEARAARQIRANLGGILGTELGVAEYPSAFKATGATKEAVVVPVASLEYPSTTGTEDALTSTLSTAYPEVTTTTTETSSPYATSTSSYASSSPTPVVTTGTYAGSTAGISSDSYYGVAGFAPDNYNRFVTYPSSTQTTEKYPFGTPYPVGSTYPTGTGYPTGLPYPRGTEYPSGKLSAVFIPASGVRITLPEIPIIKPEDRLTAPPIKTRNYFKFQEVLQGIDYSKVNLKTGYGGRLATITGKKTKYLDTQRSINTSPLGTITSGSTSLLLFNQFVEGKTVTKTYTQFTESRATGKADQGPDFSKAKFNIPKKQIYNRRKR
jgi:hypothetical protein